MTRIWALQANGRCRLQAQGHAAGSVQVCAAVSALMCALAGCVQELEAAGLARVERVCLEEGRAQLEFSGGERARGAFDTAWTGLRMLAGQYPQQVRVMEEGVQPPAAVQTPARRG